MSPAMLAAEPLTAQGFAPFGAVVALDSGGGRIVNEGRGSRRDLPDLGHAEAASRPRLAVYDISPSGPDVTVRLFERHPLSAQLFLPLAARRYLVIVTARGAAGAPDAAQARAFVASPDQGVIYHADLWHVPLVALDGAGRFLMSVWESGTGQDCIEAALGADLTVTFSAAGA